MHSNHKSTTRFATSRSAPSTSTRLLLFGLLALCALSLLWPLAQGHSPIGLGLDLAGGVIVTYRPDLDQCLDGYEDLDQAQILALAKETLTIKVVSPLQ